MDIVSFNGEFPPVSESEMYLPQNDQQDELSPFDVAPIASSATYDMSSNPLTSSEGSNGAFTVDMSSFQLDIGGYTTNQIDGSALSADFRTSSFDISLQMSTVDFTPASSNSAEYWLSPVTIEKL